MRDRWGAEDAKLEEAHEELASRQERLFDDRIEREFRAFHGKNPHVYHRLVAMAREAKSRGREAAGIELYFAVLRWEHYLGTKDPAQGFKLNDHYTSRYVRLIERECPDLRGMFRKRRLRSEIL